MEKTLKLCKVISMYLKRAFSISLFIVFLLRFSGISMADQVFNVTAKVPAKASDLSYSFTSVPSSSPTLHEDAEVTFTQLRLLSSISTSFLGTRKC